MNISETEANMDHKNDTLQNPEEDEQYKNEDDDEKQENFEEENNTLPINGATKSTFTTQKIIMQLLFLLRIPLGFIAKY